ncbi:MAG: VWA domain-containing protein [Acidobacteria bacterium]|nr:VWA domain-containing protein [Acidobacteriota bacterium]
MAGQQAILRSGAATGGRPYGAWIGDWASRAGITLAALWVMVFLAMGAPASALPPDDAPPSKGDEPSAAGPQDPAAANDESATATGGAELSTKHKKWLEEVAPLIQPEEREVFLELGRDYQRDAFIRRFWQVRDPFPRTARNEFQERWEANRDLARQLFDNPEADDRAMVMGFLGEPVERLEIRCSDYLKPLEIWRYEGTPEVRFSFYLVFIRQHVGNTSPYELWYVDEGLQPVLAWTVTGRASDRALLLSISEECVHGTDVVAALTNTLDWRKIEEENSLVPDPGDEWVRTFVSYSTDLPEDAETFPAKVEVQFPNRYQSRTLVQGLISVPAAEAMLSDLEQHPSYNFVLDGEVLSGDELFEHFRYRFNLRSDQTVVADAVEPPAPGAVQAAVIPEGTSTATATLSSTPAEPAAGGGERILPLVFQRYLRPGVYSLVVKVEDLNAHRFFRQVLDLEVPRIELFAPSTTVQAGARSTTSSRLLAEANADLDTGDHSIQVLAPQSALMTGRLRVEALTRGGGVDKVRFSLDDQPVFTKGREPYSVELNLGDTPKIHTIRATSFDSTGRQLATDEVVVNAGPHRFDVRLVEPQRGRTYSESVRAQAVVEVPEGETLDRVEFFLNDERVATLYQPPFIQPMIIPSGQPLAYVRAVGYLEDGATAEDVVFVNAPDFVDQVDIQFVELYTSVLNRRGRPVRDLPREDFRVLEDGVEQEIRRFEQVKDLPIHAGILLDVSTSMVTRLDEAVKGALRFFEQVLTPRDRAAVITFNEKPTVAVRFTNSLEVLAGGLAGLTAEGDTALYDSLIYSLYYFSGISGKRALILLSDGEDVRSQYTFDDVIDYARRTGVSVYTVGIALSGRSTDIRLKLQRLASETGGRSFFIDQNEELERVYDSIQEELRSQYLIAYQSSAEGDDFRRVEVEVSEPGLTANTLKGYFP